MRVLFDHPVAFLPAVILLLFLAGGTGLVLRRRFPTLLGSENRGDLTTLQASTLALLGLLLGFSFSMAVNRFDLRRQLEVDEANAIGTTWLRTATLDEPARTAARNVLRAYVPVRSGSLAASSDAAAFAQSMNQTGQLQAQLWQVATSAAAIRPDGIRSLFLSTVNTAIDLSERRTAALENRIPGMAWVMLLFMASAASLLTGLTLTSRSSLLLSILPLIVGAALTLILDLDTPHAGLVQVTEDSMVRLQLQIESAPR